MTIGICDWGIGGLGFYQLLRAERPDLDVVYIGDQGVPGYGLFERPALRRRLADVFRAFRGRGVSDVVVACNAASTVVAEAQVEGVRGHGIILPTLDALAHRDIRCVGVIGGRRTIRSGSYGRALRAHGCDVRQRVAQPLSRLIEDGEAGTPESLQLLSRILAPLRGVDTLVLACTHYVVLEPEIRKRLPDATLVDPATETWTRFRATLPPIRDVIGRSVFFTTGSPEAMARQAKTAFGVNADVEGISI